MRPEVAIESVTARAFTIPTDAPEADGTMQWSSTTLVLVEIAGGGRSGLGYTYSSACIVDLVRNMLAPRIQGRDAFAIPERWLDMQRAVRNVGRGGLAATAISAVDAALHDLKARSLDLPLCACLGQSRSSVPVYGSGGFTNYSNDRLQKQLAGWVDEDGCAFVKMKVGTDPLRDPGRVRAARQAIGREAGLFVDANGACTVNQALGLAAEFAREGVTWFEEPVSSDDREGLRFVRAHVEDQIEIAAGEYIFNSDDARALLQDASIDVLQADVTRCCGITGFLRVAALCDAFHIDLSGHCAPALHLHVACAAPRLRHLEWFHDHVRIERMLFDGAPKVRNGRINPDMGRSGHGLVFRAADAARFAVN